MFFLARGSSSKNNNAYYGQIVLGKSVNKLYLLVDAILGFIVTTLFGDIDSFT